MFDARRLLDRLIGGSENIFGSRRGRRFAASAAGLGGVALIAAVAYRAFQSRQGSGSLPRGVQAAAATLTGGASDPASTLPRPAAFDAAKIGEDDARLYARAMIAAVMADGQMAERERERLSAALAALGMDLDATRWVQDELANPAEVAALADPVNTPEQAAKVYAAARLAIEPDTIQEQEFLRQLAESLDLDAGLRSEIDAAASAMKAA